MITKFQIMTFDESSINKFLTNRCYDNAFHDYDIVSRPKITSILPNK